MQPFLLLVGLYSTFLWFILNFCQLVSIGLNFILKGNTNYDKVIKYLSHWNWGRHFCGLCFGEKHEYQEKTRRSGLVTTNDLQADPQWYEASCTITTIYGRICKSFMRYLFLVMGVTHTIERCTGQDFVLRVLDVVVFWHSVLCVYYVI